MGRGELEERIPRGVVRRALDRPDRVLDGRDEYGAVLGHRMDRSIIEACGCDRVKPWISAERSRNHATGTGG
jgi:hypothetical protein